LSNSSTLRHSTAGAKPDLECAKPSRTSISLAWEKLSEATATQAWWWIWLCSLGLKLVLAALIPLSNDEAYYRIWGLLPQLSYYDHPPMVGWLFSLGVQLPGAEAWPGITRWPAVLLGHFTWLMWNKLLRFSTTARQRLIVLLVILLSPLFGLGSLIVTPDLPLVATWTLALLAIQKFALRPSSLRAIGVGSTMGLAFCAKYHAVLLAPIALLVFFLSPRFQSESFISKFKQASLALISGLVFSAPVLLWNMEHDWISFRFQLSHGLEARAPQLQQVLQQVGEYVGGQLLLLSPLVWFWAWRREHPRSLRILHLASWPILIFFLWTSTRSHVEANWPIIAHFPLLTLGALQAVESIRGRRVLIATLALWISLSGLALHQAFFPHQKLFGIPAENHKTYEFVRYAEILPALRSQIDATRPTFASSYQMAADLSLRSGELFCKLSGYNRRDFFDFLDQCHPLKARPQAANAPTDSVPQEFQVIVDEEGHWPSWIHEFGYVRKAEQALTGRFKLVIFKRESRT